MRLIRPTTLTDAMLTSSTAPEADYPAWSSATAYAVGARVTGYFSAMTFIRSMSSFTLSWDEPHLQTRADMMPILAWFAVQPDAASCSALLALRTLRR